MFWQDEMRNNVTEIDTLAPALGIPQAEAEQLRRLLEYYPMSIPRYYLSLVDGSDPEDPIRKMCVPATA